MLKLFRSLTKSKLGIVVFALFLGAIALGFVAADLQNIGVSGAASSDAVAEVGGEEISVTQLQSRVQRAYDLARQQNPALTLPQFIAQGGVETELRRISDGLAIEQFAKKHGLGVSRKMEDGQIAAAPAFRALNGQFDQAAFEAFLVREGISEREVRGDIARDLYLNQLIVPAAGAVRAPDGLVLQYASMLLEQRQGRAQFVPAAAMRVPAPGDAEVNGFYRRNLGRYTIPERRVIRYAFIDRARFEAAAQPSEAEIAQAFRAGQASFAARETRTLTQVILPTQAAATALATSVSGGVSIADAARAAGLEAVTLNDQSREAYTGASAPAVAASAFAAGQGQVATPARSSLGWHVVRIDAITTIPARTLDQARPEIVARLAKDKADRAFEDGRLKIEDAVADGATFDEVVSANGLQPVTTPPLLANGRNPDAPEAAPEAELAPILTAAFTAEADDEPVVEQLAPAQRAVLIKLERIIPATPRPLAQILAQVAQDFVTDRQLSLAKSIAEAVATRANGGASLAQAAAQAGAALPAATQIGGVRRDVLAEGQQLSPQIATLFRLAQGRARAVPAPDRSGWYVVQLERAVRGDARAVPQLTQTTAEQLGPVLGQEYAQQLVAAARAEVGVTVNNAAVAKLKRDLTGATGNGG